MTDATHTSRSPGIDRTGHDAPPVGRVLVAITTGAVIVGVALRFVPRGDLWLDEALSANISALAVGDIPDALRHDGHPPLYYFLLHAWGLLGSSDWWVRALSGIMSVLGLPLAYAAGRRLGRRKAAEGLGSRRVGLITLAVWSVLPFAVRYGAETRMYALVSTLVLAGYLLVDNLLTESSRADRPPPPPLPSAIGLALVTALLLWTHYWTLWLGAAVALTAVVVAVRSVAADRRRRAWITLGALAVGALLFTPWLPTMLYQSRHTGTPWGEVFRPATILVVTITDFVGGGFGELQIMAYILFSAIAVATFGALRTRAGRQVVELVAVPRGRILAELTVLVGTLGIGWAVSALSSSTYASRYAAVVAPLFALCVAGGLAMARSTRFTAVLTLVVCAALVLGSVVEIFTDRTQAGVVADRLAEDLAVQDLSSTGDRVVVLTCPDQLAPSIQRALSARGIDAEVVAFPDSDGDPRFVDWVDYAERSAAVDPAAFTAAALADVDPGDPVYAVINTSYRTLEGRCEGVLAALGSTGEPLETLVEGDADEFFEGMSLWVRRPRS